MDVINGWPLIQALMNTIGKEAVFSVERFFEYEPHTTTRDKMSNELLDTQRNVWHKFYGARGAGL